MNLPRWMLGLLATGALCLSTAVAQDLKYGAPIPAVHRTLFEKGLEYLVKEQWSDGTWESNTGVTGICVMALLASGEDPNFGKYAAAIRSGTRAIIQQQSADTGFIRSGMYEHGFAMLTLADCYGAVDDRLLWKDQTTKGRSIGEAL